MKAMILAAGRGERMRPLTDSIPKPLLPVGDQRLIEHHLRALASIGTEEVVINIAWLGEQIQAYLDDGQRYGLKIHYSAEPEGALQTGGGVFQALPLLGSEPFWLVNGDVRTDFPFTTPVLTANQLGHLVLVDNPEHNPSGDFALETGSVANTGASMLTYTGIALLRPELFAGQSVGRFPLAPLLREAAEDGRLSGELYSGVWIDVGTPERLSDAASVRSN